VGDLVAVVLALADAGDVLGAVLVVGGQLGVGLGRADDDGRGPVEQVEEARIARDEREHGSSSLAEGIVEEQAGPAKRPGKCGSDPVVPNDLAGGKEDHVLGNVGGMVGDSLQVLGDREQVEVAGQLIGGIAVAATIRTIWP